MRPLTCITVRLAQVDVEIKYEDLDDLDDGESDSDVDAVRASALAVQRQTQALSHGLFR
jgi:hypothetical protein